MNRSNLQKENRDRMQNLMTDMRGAPTNDEIIRQYNESRNQ